MKVESKEPLVTRDILIRLKPFTEASKEFICKDRKKNSLLQFRLKIVVSGGTNTHNQSNTNKTVRDIIRVISKKWGLRQR